MKAKVNELLTYGRLPFHYWNQVRGGGWPWDNPGCSLISFCALHLNQQVITVPPELLSSVDDCRAFTTDPQAIMQVMKWVEAQSEKLVVKANMLADSDKVFVELNTLINHVTSLRGMLSVVFGGVTPNQQLDLEQELSIMFLQSLIDVKLDIERLDTALHHASSGPSTPS